MRAQDDPGVAAHEVLDCGQGGPNARVVGDDSRPGYERNVEVRSYQDGLTFDIDIPNRLLVWHGSATQPVWMPRVDAACP